MNDELPIVQMIKCDGCGDYHPVADCEVVIIKLTKGKNCAIQSGNQVRISADSTPRGTLAPIIAPFVQTIVPNDGPKTTTTAPGFVEDKPGEGYHIPPTVMEQRVKTVKRGIIPPGLAAMMISDGDASFETKGAKEIRRF